MRSSPIEQRIFDVSEPVAQDLGLEIVCVKIIGEGGSRSVQIMAEDPDTRKLGLDDCAKLSRAISAVMDVENIIEDAYRLEVSSPGIDRPLMKSEDFDTFKGYEAKLEISMPDENGQKRFRGYIKGITDNTIEIETDKGLAEIPFDLLTKAKLVLTDELIKATANK